MIKKVIDMYFKEEENQFYIGRSIIIVNTHEENLRHLIGVKAKIKYKVYSDFFDSYIYKLDITGEAIFFKEDIKKIRD